MTEDSSATNESGFADNVGGIDASFKVRKQYSFLLERFDTIFFVDILRKIQDTILNNEGMHKS